MKYVVPAWFLRTLTCLLLAHLASAQENKDYTQQSLEDLMNIEVTSVSKKSQKLSATPAAIYVITQDDIRHSGALNIPDLLRMVPGVNVAQINSSTWAISARGFNEHFSDKLLVMIDGRSVYTPTFSGVYWDGVDIPLENIERIEVIRGPGGSSWGANAVNGVINIITKNASQTRGGMIVAGGGNLHQGFGTIQYGSRVGSNTNYRVFTKYSNQTHMAGLASDNGADQWDVFRAGFRSDTNLSSADSLTLQGDLYVGREGQSFPQFTSFAAPGVHIITVAPPFSGGYFQTGWTHHYSDGSDSTLQFYFDRYHREGILNESRNTFNIDFQHRLRWGTRQDIVWGTAYRGSILNSVGNLSFSLVPADLTTQLFSSFLQDEIALIPNHLSFTLGTKLEHNYYTGWGVLPSARLAWKVSDRSTAWAAVSRAIRTPASFDTAPLAHPAGYMDAGGLPVVVRLEGNPRPHNEDLLAYEAGYRTTISERLSIDTAAYFNIYTHSTTIEPLSPFFETSPFPPHVIAPITVANRMHGESHGFESFATYRITDRWTLTPAYAFEQMHLHLATGSLDTQSVPNKEGSTPHHWARMASQFRLPRGVGWNVSSTFVDRLPARRVPGYVRLDSQLSWSVRENLSLAIVGQNLLREKHIEFVDIWSAITSTQLERSVFAKFTWTF
jgi:iron complex outermembrane recepter protein